MAMGPAAPCPAAHAPWRWARRGRRPRPAARLPLGTWGAETPEFAKEMSCSRSGRTKSYIMTQGTLPPALHPGYHNTGLPPLGSELKLNRGVGSFITCLPPILFPLLQPHGEKQRIFQGRKAASFVLSFCSDFLVIAYFPLHLVGLFFKL